jgi:hypothetical protein
MAVCLEMSPVRDGNAEARGGVVICWVGNAAMLVLSHRGLVGLDETHSSLVIGDESEEG